MIPGPKVTIIGLPVPSTISPGFKLVVSSYTCIVVKSLVIPITSPISLDSPTYTISSIEKEFVFFIVTTGPFIPYITFFSIKHISNKTKLRSSQNFHQTIDFDPQALNLWFHLL